MDMFNEAADGVDSVSIERGDWQYVGLNQSAAEGHTLDSMQMVTLEQA